MKTTISLLVLSLLVSYSLYSQESYTWIKTNGPYCEEINSIDINSRDEIFVTTNTQGILKSTNNGDSWEAKNNGLDTLRFDRFYINNKDVMVVQGAKGFYKSTDYGDNWILINKKSEDKDKTFIGISNNGIIFANKEISKYRYMYFKSYDDGANWDTLKTPIDYQLHFFISSVFGGKDELVIIVGQYDIDLLHSPVGYIYISLNEGENWKKIKSDFPILSTSSVPVIFNSKGVIFNGMTTTMNRNKSGGLFRTSNYGETWDYLTNGFYTYEPSTICIDKKDNIYFANGMWLLRSKDNGETWAELTTREIVYGIENLAINSKGIMFAVNPYEAIYKSKNISFPPESQDGLITCPNPFSNILNIKSDFGNIFVNLSIFNSYGEKVKVEDNIYLKEGADFTCDFGNLPDGIYFIKVNAGDRVITKKVMLIK
jgi:photosystem II stability/assembly factor-like uncharacterized protein